MDNINPSHYKDSCSLECIQVMKVAFGTEALLSFCVLNAFKYLWRYKYKNHDEDVAKARWYLSYAKGLISKYEIPDSKAEAYNRVNDLFTEIASWKKRCDN